ncbi:MAG: ribulose-phosphate 3-epimerase [Mogibacterium sp.]|nr:ribulose-phosphate 3-epimerase [Mogibacterium sp.]
MAEIKGDCGALIAPSILAADFARLGEDVRDVCERGIDYLHIDVMDGAFVPNISFGSAVMKSLNGIATVPYDVHLMVEEPIRYIGDFLTDNTEFITVHQEACKDLRGTLRAIHDLGVKAGVSIKPNTAPEVLDEYLAEIDLILVMSVEPGFGGQKFMDNSLPKISYFRDKREELGFGYLIEVDGGIGSANANLVIEAGVDIIVAGSAVFKAADRTAEIRGIKGIEG